MHRKGAAKAAQNQRTIALRNNTAPLFHRKSTVLSTEECFMQRTREIRRC